MKPSPHLVKIGKWLMRRGRLRIVIADDEEVYFNERMLRVAGNAGYHGIERTTRVTHEVLAKWLKKPPDIVILDIRNVCDPDVAKDGVELARTLLRETNSMIVITSAHKFHLRKSFPDVDYIIENRHLTSVDFVDELSNIVEKYLTRKTRFYKHLSFRIGMSLARGALQAAG